MGNVLNIPFNKMAEGTSRQINAWMASLCSPVHSNLHNNPSQWAFRQENPIASKMLWHSINIAEYAFLTDPPAGYLAREATEHTALTLTAKATAALLAVGTAYANKHPRREREVGMYHFIYTRIYLMASSSPYLASNHPAALRCQQNWVVDGIFTYLSECRADMFASLEHDRLPFIDGAMALNQQTYSGLVGEDGWRFAHSLVQGGGGYFPFIDSKIVEKIIRFFVTSPSSLYRRLLRTFEEFPSLKEHMDPYGKFGEIFPIHGYILGLVCVSMFVNTYA